MALSAANRGHRGRPIGVEKPSTSPPGSSPSPFAILPFARDDAGRIGIAITRASFVHYVEESGGGYSRADIRIA